LRVAARHQNSAVWIDALQSPDRSPRIFVRTLSHRARIQHNNLSIASYLGALQSALQELAFQGSPVSLRRATPKIFYVEAGHTPILNEWMVRLKRGGLSI